MQDLDKVGGRLWNLDDHHVDRCGKLVEDRVNVDGLKTVAPAVDRNRLAPFRRLVDDDRPLVVKRTADRPKGITDHEHRRAGLGPALGQLGANEGLSLIHI